MAALLPPIHISHPWSVTLRDPSLVRSLLGWYLKASSSSCCCCCCGELCHGSGGHLGVPVRAAGGRRRPWPWPRPRQQEEEEADADGGAQGQHGLRGVRAQGQERALLHERGPISEYQQEAAEGDGGGVRGAQQGAEEGAVHGEEGRDMALRALQPGQPALRRRHLRQAGPGRLRQEPGAWLRQRVRPGQQAARPAHRHVQRRQRQLLRRHVM